jgi:hypothetical protein
MEKIHLIATRTRDRLACSIVPRPTTLPRAPISLYTRFKNKYRSVYRPTNTVIYISSGVISIVRFTKQGCIWFSYKLSNDWHSWSLNTGTNLFVINSIIPTNLAEAVALLNCIPETLIQSWLEHRVLWGGVYRSFPHSLQACIGVVGLLQLLNRIQWSRHIFWFTDNKVHSAVSYFILFL